MGLEDELRETARRMRLRNELGASLRDQGLDLGEGVDPLAALLRGAGLDLDGDDVDGFYDAMLADLEEGES